MTMGRILGFGAALAATLAVAASIWLNPPSENRARMLDAQRVSQLSTIEGAINMHYRKHKKIPGSFEELATVTRDYDRTTLLDPGTGQPFEYEVLNEKGYRLCITFERSTDDDPSLTYARQHKAGRDCFENQVIVITP